MKTIQINGGSLSLILKNYESDIFENWYAQVAFHLKKQYPKIAVEAWTPERLYNNEKTKKVRGVKFRIFPTTISIRHSMEISWEMINALKKEAKIFSKKKEKLIIHFHEYHSWQVYLILLLIKKSKNIKIIAQHHGGRSPFANLRKYKRLFLAFPVIGLMQLAERFLFRKIDLFYPLSNEEIDYLKKVSPGSKIKFQTMGISEEYFKKIGRKKARKKLGLNLNKKYVLYLGRIKTTKGIKELLDAARELKKDAELLLIGEGVDFEKYKDYAVKNRIKNAKFLGPLYGEKKLLYLSAADCLILPSHTEGAPVVLMEALAKNLPVIATNVGGIPKMIKNKKEGIIINPNKKGEIKKAIKEILLWKPKNLAASAERYLWKKIIKRTLRDYERI